MYVPIGTAAGSTSRSPASARSRCSRSETGSRRAFGGSSDGVAFPSRRSRRHSSRRDISPTHVRDGGPVRRARHGVRDARVRPARTPRRAARPGRDRDRGPRVLRARGDPRMDGGAHPVRRRLRARRRQLLRPAERVHRSLDRLVPVGGAPPADRSRRRAPGRRGTVRGLPYVGANLGGGVSLFAAAGLWLAVRERERLGLWKGLGVFVGVTLVGAACDPPRARDLSVRDACRAVRGGRGRDRRGAREVPRPPPGRVRPHRAQPVRADPRDRSPGRDRGRAPSTRGASSEPAT